MGNFCDRRVSPYYPWKLYHHKLDCGDYQVGYAVTDYDKSLEYPDELKAIEPYNVANISRADILKHWNENWKDFIDEYNEIDICGIVDLFTNNVVNEYFKCYIVSVDDEDNPHCVYNPNDIKSEIEWCYRDVLISLLTKENNND